MNNKKGNSKTSGGRASSKKAGQGKAKPAFAFDKSTKGTRGAVRAAKPTRTEDKPKSKKASAKSPYGNKGAAAARPAKDEVKKQFKEKFEQRSGIKSGAKPRGGAASARAPKSFSRDRDAYKTKEQTGYNEDDFFGRTSEEPKSPRSSASKSAPAKKSTATSKRNERSLVKKKVEKDFIDIKFSKEKQKTDEIHRELNVKKVKQKGKAAESDNSDGIRLNRYIANAGIASRREADQFILEGLVKVNGVVITELGVKVQPTDSVKFRNKVITPERNVYVLLNKPKDFITTTDDPQERRTVMQLVANAGKERIVPVGRLDRNTTGLLLLTNDGELAQKLTHPSSNIKKIYLVEIDKPISEKDFETIKTGKLRLFDGPVKVDDLAVTDQSRKVIGIEIHEGRNRIVRRIFEELGYNVEKLDRVAYAGLTKKDLSRGKWRYLTPQEINRLKYLV